MSKGNKNASSKKEFFLLRWFKRMFFGGSKELLETTIANERYDSPGKLAVKRFFRRPAALIAVIVLVSMFIFVFVGPLFSPSDLSYEDTSQKNIRPTFSMLSMPSELETNLKEISSNTFFSVGVSNDGKLYMWGYTDFLSGVASLEIPEAVKNATIIHAAAGYDHVVAIGDDGTVYTWGQFDNGQYGRDGSMYDLIQFPEPNFLIDDKIDAANVKQVACGFQVSAILMNDGTLYAWGNAAAGATNMGSMRNLDNIDKIYFTNSTMLGVSKDGDLLAGGASAFSLLEIEGSSEIYDTNEYIGDRKIVDIATTADSGAVLLEDGELLVMGGRDKSVRQIPTIPEGDKIVSIEGGMRHYALLTEKGRVYAWGNSKLGQTDVPDALTEEGAADTIYSVAYQNYIYKDGKLVEKFGHKGYLMGTDHLGRDIFNRVINGGRMTMTIGAVAVIVSSIIGIIIGCISGYFGGKVDLLLMRVTEIFGAIPFLPFALVLSSILRASSVHETMRIFIIMVILGLLSWTGLARLVRGQVLAEREKEFVIAAKSMGVKEKRIAFKHILPNIVSVIIVTMTLDFASCMLTESSLSYLGFGVQLPRPTWGNMLDGCNDSIVIQSYWWRWLFPAIFLSIAVICVNVIGDTLRDVLDPKSEVEK